MRFSQSARFIQRNLLVFCSTLTLCGISPVGSDTVTFRDGRKMDGVQVTPRMESVIVRFCSGNVEEFSKSIMLGVKWSKVNCDIPWLKFVDLLAPDQRNHVKLYGQSSWQGSSVRLVSLPYSRDPKDPGAVIVQNSLRFDCSASDFLARIAFQKPVFSRENGIVGFQFQNNGFSVALFKDNVFKIFQDTGKEFLIARESTFGSFQDQDVLQVATISQRVIIRLNRQIIGEIDLPRSVKAGALTVSSMGVDSLELTQFTMLSVRPILLDGKDVSRSASGKRDLLVKLQARDSGLTPAAVQEALDDFAIIRGRGEDPE